jgi:hypothetical protein
MRRAVAFALAFAALTSNVGLAQVRVDLLACQSVDVVSPDVFVQFERELFPPSTDTGLLESNSEQLLYVERGPLTIYSDGIGAVSAVERDVWYFPPQTVFAVGNESVEEVSVLWLRLEEPVAQAYAAPAALRIVRAAWQVEEVLPEPQPLFVAFPLEQGRAVESEAALVIAAITLNSFQRIDPIEQIGQDLADSGMLAIVVESGSLQVDDGSGQVEVAAREFTTIDGERELWLVNAGEAPARAFVVGVVAAADAGQIGQLIVERGCAPG